jgi:hypothetical protein
VVVVTVLVTVLVAELAVRARASALPDHQVWYGPEMQFKQHQVRALEDDGGASVVFLGSSTTDVGIDPSGIDLPRGARPAYNASTGAGSIGMIATWAQRFAIPRLRPDVVVLGLVSREFNPNDSEQVRLEREFFAAPAVRHLMGNESVWQRMERVIEQRSALFRYRTVLREPRYWRQVAGLGDAVTTKTYGEIVAPDGQYEGFLHTAYRNPPEFERRARRTVFRDFEVGAEKRRTLRELLTFLRARARQVVLVNMPVTADYVAGHPRGQADYDDFVGMLRAEASRAGARLLDAGIWPRSLFADPGHVNAGGARRLTALLNDELNRTRVSSAR